MSQDDTFGPLRKGLLELAVLSVVSAHEVYAADILDRLASTELATGEGTLYPLLSRMKRDGLLDYSWAESPSGPPRKYYKLAASGRTRMRESQKYLYNLNQTLQELGDTHA